LSRVAAQISAATETMETMSMERKNKFALPFVMFLKIVETRRKTKITSAQKSKSVTFKIEFMAVP
jgi:hypothetical protein